MTFPSAGSAGCGARPRCAGSSPRPSCRVDDLVAPLFVREGIDEPAADRLAARRRAAHPRVACARRCASSPTSACPAVILFGVPGHKDADGLAARGDPDGIVQVALRDLRDEVGDALVLMADLCLDEYTDHGHCGVLTADGDVDNDATLELYAAVAVAQADAGADVVAPSGMMDGQVGAIRAALDDERPRPTSRSSPTRPSTPPRCTARSATRSTCRSPAAATARATSRTRATRARRSRRSALDIAEGADMVMVKPALAYLDVIAARARRVRRAGRGVPRVAASTR